MRKWFIRKYYEIDQNPEKIKKVLLAPKPKKVYKELCRQNSRKWANVGLDQKIVQGQWYKLLNKPKFSPSEVMGGTQSHLIFLMSFPSCRQFL